MCDLFRDKFFIFCSQHLSSPIHFFRRLRAILPLLHFVLCSPSSISSFRFNPRHFQTLPLRVSPSISKFILRLSSLSFRVPLSRSASFPSHSPSVIIFANSLLSPNLPLLSPNLLLGRRQSHLLSLFSDISIALF